MNLYLLTQTKNTAADAYAGAIVAALDLEDARYAHPLDFYSWGCLSGCWLRPGGDGATNFGPRNHEDAMSVWALPGEVSSLHLGTDSHSAGRVLRAFKNTEDNRFLLNVIVNGGSLPSDVGPKVEPEVEEPGPLDPFQTADLAITWLFMKATAGQDISMMNIAQLSEDFRTLYRTQLT